jgi:CDP-diacylglycerol--glycerol-3-phosphate 3-phosphatidyltransferase
MRLAGRRLLAPVIGLLSRMGVSPAAVTFAGLAVTLLSALMIWRGDFLIGALTLALGSALDAVDGGIARHRGTESRSGAVLDSVVDRIGELLVLGALLVSEIGNSYDLMLYLVPLAIGGSYLVSYVRARAEGVGISCSVGIFTRTERLVLIVAGLVLAGTAGTVWMVYITAAIAAGTWFTAGQRMARVFSEDRA